MRMTVSVTAALVLAACSASDARLVSWIYDAIETATWRGEEVVSIHQSPDDPASLDRTQHDRRCPNLARQHASRKSSTDDLCTSSAVSHDRVRPRKRHGVPMRTSALGSCAPAERPKLLRTMGLGVAIPGDRGRRARSGGAGSDPSVRGPATGSGPCAFAHPRPLPLGSLPDQRSLGGKAVRAPLRSGGPRVRCPSVCRSGGRSRYHSIRRTSLHGPMRPGDPSVLALR